MWDLIMKRVFDVLKILGIAVPTVLAGWGYINSEVIFKAVSDNLQPAITAQLKKEIPIAVSTALLNTVIQTKLDSIQMNALEISMMEYQEATLAAIPGETAKQGRLMETKILTRKYKIHDSRTGDHIQNLVGVKQAGGEWFLYIENIKQ